MGKNMHRRWNLFDSKPIFIKNIRNLWLFADTSVGMLILIGLFITGCQDLPLTNGRPTPVRPTLTRETLPGGTHEPKGQMTPVSLSPTRNIVPAGTRETIKDQVTPVLLSPTRETPPVGTREAILISTPLPLTQATTTPMVGQQIPIGRQIPFDTLASGDQASDFPQRAEIVVRSAEDWAVLWKRVNRSVAPVPDRKSVV